MNGNLSGHSRSRAALLGLALGALALSGCGEARKSLGLERAPPDEFSVVARAPLSMPPEMKLQPPRPGAPRPQEGTIAQQAAGTVFGTGQGRPGAAGAMGTAGSSRGEAALLGGAGKAQTDIRAVVDAETRSLVAADRRWVDTLIFWQKQDQPASVVNPQEEARRLRENATQGKPVTTGETPTIERRRKAPLEGLF